MYSCLLYPTTGVRYRKLTGLISQKKNGIGSPSRMLGAIMRGSLGAFISKKKTISGYNLHNNDVIMSAMSSQITSLAIVYSTVYSGANQRQHQSSESLAFVRGIQRWPVNSTHKGPVTRKMFPFDDVIMDCQEDEPATPLATTNRWRDAFVFSWEMHNVYMLENKITTTASIT